MDDVAFLGRATAETRAFTDKINSGPTIDCSAPTINSFEWERFCTNSHINHPAVIENKQLLYDKTINNVNSHRE